jgi:sugar phosphate isomerase/epimerase
MVILTAMGRIDFPAVRKAMDDIGYTGWIQIEGAVPKGQPLVESHVQNVRFMRAPTELVDVREGDSSSP